MFLAEAGKFAGAKVATAVVFLAVIAGGIWCYQNPESVKAFGQVVKLTLLWLVLVAALPWSSYLFMGQLLRFQAGRLSDSGATILSMGLIAGYCLVDILLAFYLGDFGDAGTFSWIVVLLGFAAAGTYNFVICESLARHGDA